MNDPFSHLSENEVEQLIQRYYNKEKIADLIEEFNIPLIPSQLVRHFPPEIMETKCVYCDISLIKPRKSRDKYNAIWNKSVPTCPNCGHKEIESCWCSNCKKLNAQRIEKEHQEKQDLLDKILWVDEEDKIDLESLSFYEKIYLGALLREGISEDYNYIKPIETFFKPLAPTPEFQSEISDLLIDNKIIVIHPSTDPQHITIKDIETGNYSYYPYKVNWALNVKKEGVNKVPLIDSIINPPELKEEDYEKAFSLWKKIALYETIEYFNHSVNNILGIDYNVGDKTVNILKDLLNYYSVSQVYGIIYKSTNNALRFQAENEVSRKHAANTIIGNAQSFGERARVNKWDLQKYNRIKECPESALSKFFFERILRIGNSGFYEVPNKEMIKNEI